MNEHALLQAAKAIDPDLFSDDEEVAAKAAFPADIERGRSLILDNLRKAVAVYEKEAWGPADDALKPIDVDAIRGHARRLLERMQRTPHGPKRSRLAEQHIAKATEATRAEGFNEALYRARGKIAALEALRPHWAMGYSDDSVAAQIAVAALAQLWNRLGVNNQSSAIAELSRLRGEKERPLTAAVLADALGAFWNAALGSAHSSGNGMVSSAISAVVEGVAAVQTRLAESSARKEEATDANP